MARRIDSLLARGTSRLEGARSTSRSSTDPAPTLPAILPLPTGYGLQVIGPDGEQLWLPVCLPPGFQLETMILRPEFLATQRGVRPEAERLSAAVEATPRTLHLVAEGATEPQPVRRVISDDSRVAA